MLLLNEVSLVKKGVTIDEDFNRIIFADLAHPNEDIFSLRGHGKNSRDHAEGPKEFPIISVLYMLVVRLILVGVAFSEI